MAVFLMCLQFVLEEGAKEDWFANDLILLLTVVVAITGPVFVWRSLTSSNPIVELRAFTNRNFVVGVIMTFIVGAALFGGSFLMPLFLSRVRDYSAAEVGTTMIVSGLSMFAVGPFVGRLVRKVDARILMFTGFMMAAWGMWDARYVTGDWGFWEFAGVQAMRGAGVMIAMIASQQVTMTTLPPHMVKNASGLVNLSRNVGGAMGLALLNTSLTENSARHMVELTSAVDQTNTQMRQMIDAMAQRFADSVDPHASALKAVYGMFQKEATTLAFGDAFALLAVACAFAAFVTLLSRPAKPGGAQPPSEVH